MVGPYVHVRYGTCTLCTLDNPALNESVYGENKNVAVKCGEKIYEK